MAMKSPPGDDSLSGRVPRRSPNPPRWDRGGGVSGRQSRLAGRRNTREKELSGGEESGKFPREGEIDAIAVIELDIISIIIIIISTIYTAISTAASHHRCNALGPVRHRNKTCLVSIEMTYYIVFEGRVPGVYEEWEDCKKQVHKFSGNCYKGYPTRHEAVAKWRKHQSNKSMKTFVVLSLLLTIVAAVLYFILV
ncbi:hypothetical protein QYE76_054604 [Lolium multiflorum]|uniref:Ribonuclease H n=1 Tax=Lolium multiflorum TaxID=4521 RepID=A0AAD8WNN3_LOLMU|nr:hypothetical protein QYE76_054604 [Lolium multiflorum]